MQGQEPWYQPLEQPGVTVARSNPDNDPSGYFALFVAQLAEKFSGQAGLKQQILGDDRNPAQLIGPATGNLLAKLQSGQLDALFAYSTVATSFGLPYVPLSRRGKPQRPRPRDRLRHGLIPPTSTAPPSTVA